MLTPFVQIVVCLGKLAEEVSVHKVLMQPQVLDKAITLLRWYMRDDFIVGGGMAYGLDVIRVSCRFFWDLGISCNALRCEENAVRL